MWTSFKVCQSRSRIVLIVLLFFITTPSSHGLNINRSNSSTLNSSASPLITKTSSDFNSTEKSVSKIMEEIRVKSTAAAVATTIDKKTSLSDLKEKNLDRTDVNYPELFPGRPITGYLVVGIAFVLLAIIPYLFYAAYVIFVPDDVRPSKFRRTRALSPFQLRQDVDDDPYGHQVIQATRHSECIEKIMCRLSSRAHQFGMADWMGMDGSILENIPVLSPNWRNRLYRGMWTGSQTQGQCNQFHCDPMARFWGDWRQQNGQGQGTPVTTTLQHQHHQAESPYDHNNSIHK